MRPVECRRFPLDPCQQKKKREAELVGLPDWGIGDKTGNVCHPGMREAETTSTVKPLALYQDPSILAQEAKTELEAFEEQTKR